MPSSQGSAVLDADQIRAVIGDFLRSARQPALHEPGEELLPLAAGAYSLEMRGSRLTLEVWDRTRNLNRRILSAKPGAARVDLTVERFPRREGLISLVDLARPAGANAAQKSARLVFRERFRLFLRRQFGEWTLAEISSEANLEHSLSPAFPRALLKHGQHAWAAIACPPDGSAGAALSFGLIWLAYLRARQKRVAVEGLAIYVPAGKERAVVPRLLCLDPSAGRFELYTYNEHDHLLAADQHDHGNLDSRLEICRRPPAEIPEPWARVAALPGVERVPKHDGRLSLRVRGVEFAELSGGEMAFGLRSRRRAREDHLAEIAALASELNRVRSPESAERAHALYRQAPEAWLESAARADIETLDATLLPEPVYGQTPVFAGGERGVVDLLAVDRSGRLAVIELKATADLHLPLQALDYWIRVKLHLDRGEFTSAGYFPGVALRPAPPRLLLASPSLEFHPATETLLSYFSPAIEVERIGLGLEWRKGLQVMFRLLGSRRPD